MVGKNLDIKGGLLKIIKEVFYIILSGIFIAWVTSYLLSVPSLVVTDSTFSTNSANGDVELNYTLKNNGSSAADNISTKIAFVRDGDEKIEILDLELERQYEKIEAGDSYFKTIRIPTERLSDPKDGNIVFLIQVKFKDINSFREKINKILPGKQYELNEWGQYIKGHVEIFYPEKEQINIYKEDFIKKLN